IYSFNGTGIKEALSLQLGDTVHIFEQYGTGSQSWFRGVALRDKETMGIFPATFIHIKPAEVDNKGKYETVIPVEDPVVKEATYVLREWSIHLKTLCMKNHSLFSKIYETMIQMMLLRVQLMYISLTKDEAAELKKEITARIDWGNSQLEMDLVPRINGVQIDPDQCSIVKLHRIHETTSHLVSSPQPKVKSLGATLRWSGDTPTVGGVGMRHVLVNIKNFGCAVGDNSDTLLSLYHVRDNVCTCLTESFLIRHDSKLVPLDIEKLQNYYGLFCDLTQDDIEKDIFLVAHIYRLGRMHAENSKKPPSTAYRRPWGVGVVYLNLSKLPEQIREYDYQIKVQSCTENTESSFSSLHEQLIKKLQTGTLGSSTKDRLGPGLSISIQLMKGDLNRVRKDNPVVFSKGVTQIQKLGFTDIITPVKSWDLYTLGAVRNDLYVTLQSGEFDRGSKTAQRNIEVKVTVYDAQKQQIEDCFNYGCGEPPKSEFQSSVYYHNNKPEWKETIKLSIPIDRFPGSHMLFELFHCSVKKKEMKKPFGFAHMKVTNEENIVQKDTTHYLCVHKLEGQHVSLAACTSLPSFLEDLNDARLNLPTSPIGPMKNRNQKEYLTISTLLCSSKFTQNGDLLGILSWRPDDTSLMENLAQLENIPGDEIMKFLQDVLDSLFRMFSYQSQNSSVTVMDLNQRIFKTLVHIFTLLQHSRFENFQPVLEAFLTDGFSSTLVYRDLILCCAETVRTAISGNHVVQSVSVFHTLGYTMKFIVQSRQLQMKDVFSHGSDGESEFLRNLEQLFDSMAILLANKTNQIGKAAQMALLGNLHTVYDPLLQVISEKNLTDFIQLALQNMPKASEIPEDLTKAKLELLQRTVASKVFQTDESRDELISLCMEQIKNCIKDKKHKALAIELLGDILDIIFNLKKTMSIQKDIKTVVSAIFDVVMQSAIESSNEKSWASLAYTLSARKAEGSLVACVLEMLRLMDDDHYTVLMQLHPRGPQLKEFLKYILQLFKHLVQPVYPKDWTVMRMVTNSVIFTAVEYFSEALRKYYMNGDSFDFELWSLYFNLAVEFVTQPSLQLDQYSEAKQEKIKERYQDMRVLMGIQIETSWTSLGANNEQFIPSLIGPFLELTLVPEMEVRKATMPIFFDMIESDSKHRGNFERVAKEMIERLDYFITRGQGDKDYKDLFQTILLDKVESEPSLRENGKKFIFSVTDLLERLLDYREVIDGEEHRDKRMHCTFNILNFYDGMKREEMYFRYINKLFELHLLASNYVEAGMTLREYATKLVWSETVLPEELRYCSQSVSSRKEQVYLEIINCFDQGKVWEYGIPLCKELADYYEKKFEYKKLSDILRKQASFYNKILEGVPSDDQETFFPRQDPSYYRVAYYGQSFPPFVRNKMFIYRGDECLKLQTIMNHLSAEYPNASFIGPNNQLKESMKEEDQQYIQICSVKPVPTERVEFKDKNVPAEIKSFYNVNEVDTFQVDRPFHKGERDPNNDYKTLCIERTTVKTNYKFPGILRWYEVVAMEVSHLNSIQVAMETIKQNTEEIQWLNERCKADPKLYFTQLEMRLNGTIHAAVQGGVTKYHEAFFGIDFELEHPDEYIYLDDLRVLMMSQLKVIGEGLKIHDQLVPPELEPLHKTMVASFKKMGKDVRKFCSLDPDPVQSVYLSASTISNQGSLLNIRESKMSLVDDVFMDISTKKETKHYTPNGQRLSTNHDMESSIPPPVPSRPSSFYQSKSDTQISPQGELPKVRSDPTVINPDAQPSPSTIPRIPYHRKTKAVFPMNHDEPPSAGEQPPPLPSKESFRQSQANLCKEHPPVATSKPKPNAKPPSLPPPLPNRKLSNYINGPAVPPIPKRSYKSESDLTDNQSSAVSKVTNSNKKTYKVGTSVFYDNVEMSHGQSCSEMILEESGASNNIRLPNSNRNSSSRNHLPSTDLSANGEKIGNVNSSHSISNNHPDTKTANQNRPTGDIKKNGSAPTFQKP
ncbi:hypothetical protein ACJMK2_016003, partial [Sinanodonta woodiana]